MNFLAHAYLSFNEPEILIGNLIADVVRGKQIDTFPEGVRRGIKIHRLIDSFTDSHPVNAKAKLVFRESVGRYDSSFLDVAYDHFLATDKDSTPAEGWEAFALSCYKEVEKRADILPSIFANVYIYMRSEDWLANYHNKWMIERSFERLKKRASYLDDNAPVYKDFEDNYQVIQDSYNAFFPDLKAYVKEIMTEPQALSHDQILGK